MKNKLPLYIFIILCLGIIAYLLPKKENSISRTDRKDFAVADTSQINKIILTSKAPETAVLERINKNYWTINQQYKARKSSIFYILKTLKRMEIAHPVPISMRDNVIGNLAVHGIKVEIFLNNGDKKIIYVGGENPELSATFMLLHGASEPYAVHIPGFQGYLSSRFFTKENHWRDKQIMNYDNNNIESVNLKYYDSNKKNESFSIKYLDSDYKLFNLNQKDLEPNLSTLKRYLASFRNLYAESFVLESLNTDSILKTKPFFDLTVNTKDNQKTYLKVFYKRELKNINRELSMRDPERMFVYVNDKDWMIIQLNGFKKVIIGLSELRK